MLVFTLTYLVGEESYKDFICGVVCSNGYKVYSAGSERNKVKEKKGTAYNPITNRLKIRSCLLYINFEFFFQ